MKVVALVVVDIIQLGGIRQLRLPWGTAVRVTVNEGMKAAAGGTHYKEFNAS